MPPVEFEPTIPASERPQTYALDSAATGTGKCETTSFKSGLYSVELAGKSTNVITKTRHYVRILEHNSTVRHHIHTHTITSDKD